MKALKYFQKLSKKRGISFIEVIYSIILLASTLVILSNMSSQSTTHLKKSNRYYIVSHLMENLLTDLEVEYQKLGPSILENKESTPFEEYPEFSWSLEVQKAPNLSLLQLEDLALPPALSGQFNTINEKFIELVQEAKLTIYYNKEEPIPSYSITTYFIDFKTIKSPSFLAELQGTLQSLGGALGQ